jgi:hypothetical protein
MDTAAKIASINPFPNDVRIAFDEYINSTNYINRERIEFNTWHQLHVYIEYPNLKTATQAQTRLKHRALADFELLDRKLYRRPTTGFPEPRYVVPESEAFDVIANEHLQLLHAGRDKVWSSLQQKYYGLKRGEAAFIIKRCKNCALNRPAATKAPLQPIVTERAWERVQCDLIDMRHEPSGQFKWILHIKDHFSKYTQLYALKSKHSEPIADAFAQFIAAFLPPKIVQADNGKEFKGALLILLRKYGIQVINGAPRSPQTQGLVEQANGVVESKLRAWKMDNGSTEWADGLVEVTLAMNTQIHSTIKCAPAELLFRERTSYIDWLNSQKRKELTVGVNQEDPTQSPIYAVQSSPISNSGSQIDIGIRSHNSEITMRISSPESGSEFSLRISPLVQRSPSPIEEWFDVDAYEETTLIATAPIATVPIATVPIATVTTPTPIATAPIAETTSIATVPIVDQVIQRAQESTWSARIKMAQKYSKRHDIQHFDIGDIVSIKVPREDRTATDNRRLFARVLDEPHSHRYKVVTMSGIIKRLIPTKEIGVVEEALWLDIIIPDTTNEVTLGLAAREASTSERVGISCQCRGLCNTKRCRCYKESRQCSVHCHRDDHDCGNLSGLSTRTEKALVNRPQRRPQRKRARAEAEAEEALVVEKPQRLQRKRARA